MKGTPVSALRAAAGRALARVTRSRRLVAVELAGVAAIVQGVREFSPGLAWVVGGVLAVVAVESQPKVKP